MESIYEYGARAGFWRLWRIFTGRKIPLTIYGVATALERSRTRRTASYAIDVVSEEDGTLRAGFQAMTYRTGRWHLGADAWPADWADRIEYRDELLTLGMLWDV